METAILLSMTMSTNTHTQHPLLIKLPLISVNQSNGGVMRLHIKRAPTVRLDLTQLRLRDRDHFENNNAILSQLTLLPTLDSLVVTMSMLMV